MIVGFIVECGPNGADEQVLKHLVKKLRPDIVPRFSTCGVRGKGEILAKCGTMVTKLFDDEHCAKVFVVWDLMPCNEEHHH